MCLEISSSLSKFYLKDETIFLSTPFQLYVTVVPSCAGSNNFQSHLISFFAKVSKMTFAIASKFSVASARIVGPAPDKQIPHRPG